MKKQNDPPGLESPGLESPGLEPTAPFTHALQSMDVTTGVVVVQTDAPDGYQLAVNVNHQSLTGTALNGIVWLCFTAPIAKPYYVTFS